MKRVMLAVLMLCLVITGCGKPPAAARGEALREALSALKDGDTETALAKIDLAIALHQEIDYAAEDFADRAGHESHLYQIKGSILFQAGDFEEAVDAYKQAYRLNERSAEACLGTALGYRVMHRDTSAYEWLGRAETLYGERSTHPPSTDDFSQDFVDAAVIDARLHLALIAALRGETQAALGAIDRLATAYPAWDEAGRWRAAVASGEFEKLMTGRE